MDDEHEDAAGRALHAELRHLADTILDLEARGRLLADAPRLLKLLGDARSRVFAYEVRGERPERPAAAPPAAEIAELLDSGRIIEDAIQREREAREEWQRPWQRRAEGEL